MSLAVLRKLGLSPGEVTVYDAILHLGSAPMNKIHERVGIERRNIYDILNKLIERGVVTYVTENRNRYFRSAHPSKLISLIEEHESELVRVKEEVSKQLPAITKLFEATRPSINSEIFRGEEGMKAAWDDMIEHGDIYWIGAGRYMPKKFPHYFASWNRKRVERNIRIHNILRGELAKEIKQPFTKETLRFLPEEFSGNPTVIGIWGNKVGNFLFGDELFVFVIESKELADNYRRYHAYLWKHVCKKP